MLASKDLSVLVALDEDILESVRRRGGGPVPVGDDNGALEVKGSLRGEVCIVVVVEVVSLGCSGGAVAEEDVRDPDEGAKVPVGAVTVLGGGDKGGRPSLALLLVLFGDLGVSVEEGSEEASLLFLFLSEASLDDAAVAVSEEVESLGEVFDVTGAQAVALGATISTELSLAVVEAVVFA